MDKDCTAFSPVAWNGEISLAGDQRLGLGLCAQTGSEETHCLLPMMVHSVDPAVRHTQCGTGMVLNFSRGDLGLNSSSLGFC